MYIRIRLTAPEHQAATIAAARAKQTLQDFVVDAIMELCSAAAETDPVVARVLEETNNESE